MRQAAHQTSGLNLEQTGKLLFGLRVADKRKANRFAIFYAYLFRPQRLGGKRFANRLDDLGRKAKLRGSSEADSILPDFCFS